MTGVLPTRPERASVCPPCLRRQPAPRVGLALDGPPRDGQTALIWIVEDTLSSLVAADPGSSDAEQHLPDGAAEGVFEAWALARDHIYHSWSWLTDVANRQPEVPLALREAADLVANSGAHFGAERPQHIVQRLKGRWDKRIVDRVREIVRSEAAASERVEVLIEFVDEAGLEAPPSPVPLPIVERDDVRLVCWMAVSAGPSA